jgi:hypothetical protein
MPSLGKEADSKIAVVEPQSLALMMPPGRRQGLNVLLIKLRHLYRPKAPTLANADCLGRITSFWE